MVDKEEGGEPLGVGVLGGAWVPGSQCGPAHGHLAVWCRVRGATPGGLPLRPSVSAGVRIWEILEFGLDFQALDQRRVLGQSLVPPWKLRSRSRTAGEVASVPRGGLGPTQCLPDGPGRPVLLLFLLPGKVIFENQTTY